MVLLCTSQAASSPRELKVLGGTSAGMQQQQAASAPAPGIASTGHQSMAAAAASGTAASVKSPLADKPATQAAEQVAITPRKDAATTQVHLQFTGGTGPTQLPGNGKPRLFTSISPASHKATARAAPEASLSGLPADFDPQAYMDYNPDVVVGMRKVGWVATPGQMSNPAVRASPLTEAEAAGNLGLVVSKIT